MQDWLSGSCRATSGAKSFAKGDVANGMLSIVGGSFSDAGGVASAAAGLANLGLFRNLSKLAVGRFAMVASTLGWVGVAIAFVETFIPGIIGVVQQEKDWKNAGRNIKDLRDKYDIAATDSEDSDSPEVKGQRHPASSAESSCGVYQDDI